VQGPARVDSPGTARTAAIHRHHADAGPVHGVIDNFSPGGQAALCSIKVFGIIVLVDRRLRLSTAVSPVFD
jgi:hypothetical protein